MNPSIADTARPSSSLCRWGLALVGLAWALQGYALWSRTYVPLVDLPNHAARHYLEYVQLSGGELPPCYRIDYRVLPNLGADLALPPLMFLFDPLTACKVFLTLAVFLYWLGPALFVWQCGGYRTQALLAALLLLPLSFSPHFFWGFLNYYSGVGLAFLALVHFGRLRRLERPRVAELLAHALLVALLFLWHLAAWGIYGVIMACHLLADLRARGLRPTLLLGLPALPGIALLLIYRVSLAEGGPAPPSQWGSWGLKLLYPLTLFRAYDWKTDAGVACLWAAAVICLFGWRLWRGLAVRGPLLSLAALTALYLVIPFQLGSTSDTDTRLLPAMMVCAVAVLAARPLRRPALGLGLLTACLLLRFGAVLHAWDRFAPRLEQHAGAFALLEPGSRVLPVVLLPEDTKEHPEKHFLAWAGVSKRIFDPTLFALRDQHTLRITVPRPRCVTARQGTYRVHEMPTRACYDFVWVYNPACKTLRLPEGFERIYADRSVTLWRVRPAREQAHVVLSPFAPRKGVVLSPFAPRKAALSRSERRH